MEPLRRTICVGSDDQDVAVDTTAREPAKYTNSEVICSADVIKNAVRPRRDESCRIPPEEEQEA